MVGSGMGTVRVRTEERVHVRELACACSAGAGEYWSKQSFAHLFATKCAANATFYGSGVTLWISGDTGWSELGGWSREEMEAAEKEIWRGESSEISQLGEWVCDGCLEGYLGGGVGDYSELRSGYVAPYPSNPWIGRSRDLSWMRKGPIGVTRREALLAAEEAKAAARAAEKAARAAEGGKGGGSGRQSREARRRKGSSSRGGVRTARREDEEPEPGEGWEGGARPEEYDGLFDGP